MYDVFHSRSPLLLRKGAVLKQTHYFVSHSAYYKPIAKLEISPEERKEDVPWDLQDKMIAQAQPKAFFSF